MVSAHVASEAPSTLSDPPLGPNTYQPHPALSAIYHYFFDRIRVDPSWVEAVRKIASRGTVVYVLPNLNFIDFFALDHLTKRFDLPQVGFVNDLGLSVFGPFSKGWVNTLLPRSPETQAEELRQAIARGCSAALFLKRRPRVIDFATGATGGRAKDEGSELVQVLIEAQRNRERPILLVPQLFVWTQRPDTLSRGPLDVLFGPREWPSPLRTAGQFLSNYRNVVLRAGEPIDLQEFLGREDAPVSVHYRRLIYALLRRLERERHGVTGPLGKAPDRVRHEILRSPRFRSELSKLSKRMEAPEATVFERADAMLREMQASPDGAVISGIDLALQRVFNRIYAGIDADPEGIERVRKALKAGPVVLLPSHKSHVDYLLLSYVFYHQHMPVPIVAAGDNLAFFPLGPLLRRAGAFFIRRSFQGDALYPVVVDAYVRRLIREGFSVELFLEGGRSRTGKLLPPKLGLLKMLVGAATATPRRRVQFVPISIGYERIVETGAFEKELSGGEKTPEDAAGLLSASSVLRYRYGRINVQIGQILTLEDIEHELGLTPACTSSPKAVRSIVTRLGNRVMDEINRVTAVTPGSLVALILLTNQRRGISHEKLLRRAERLLHVLGHLGARCAPSLVGSSGELRAESVREAAQMFLDAELLEAYEPLATAFARPVRVQARPGAIYSVPDGKRLGLDTVKNINIHFFVERALVATAMVTSATSVVERDQVRSSVQELSKLLKFEFRFRSGASFDEIFDQTLASMEALGELAREGSLLRPGPGAHGWTGDRWLETYASMLRNFLEGYRIAARGLEVLLDAGQSEKDFVKKALGTGNIMYLAGAIDRREAINKALIINACESFIDQGVLVRQDKRLALTSAFQSREALVQLEGSIAKFIER